jgi:hypothetical protein
MGYVHYHLARECDDVCVVLQNEWIEIVGINSRIPCGTVKMSLIFHDESTDVTALVRNPVALPGVESTVTAANVRKDQKKNEEKAPVQLQSLAVQVEMSPPIQLIRHSEIVSPVGELSLTFNSPMKLSTFDPQEVKCEPPAVPKMQAAVESSDSRGGQESDQDELSNGGDSSWCRPQHLQLCFIDEDDIDDSDDLMSVCRKAKKEKLRVEPHRVEVETPKPLHQISQPRIAQATERENINDTARKGNSTSENTSLRQRFARYSEFNRY